MAADPGAPPRAFPSNDRGDALCCSPSPYWVRKSEGPVVAAYCAPCGEGGLFVNNDETECAPLRPGGSCVCCCCCCCCWYWDDASAFTGDISPVCPYPSPRPLPAPRYDPKSLRCRECPLLRPGGGFDSPALSEKGGDRNRCVALGGGAAGCGPVAFRFRGDSPTA